MRSKCQKFILFLLVIPLCSCSLAPQKKITIAHLKWNSDLGQYTIKHSMDDVLELLNNKGEVVVLAEHLGRPVYLQIFYGRDRLMLKQFDKEEYVFYEE